MTTKAEGAGKQDAATSGEGKDPKKEQIRCACGAPGDLSDVQPVLAPRGALGQPDKRGFPAAPTGGAAGGAADQSEDDQA